mgnify:CR=1 FL=1
MVKNLGILVDCSGSMMDMEPKETVQSLNKNIKKIADDETSIFVAKFSEDYNLFIKNKHKNEVNIKENDIYPDGLTALYDGIFNICKDISEVCDNESNNDTTIIILTDGDENASQYTKITDIRNLININKELGWKFIFLGANQDAITTGNKMGINRNSCCTYNATSGGLNTALSCASDAIERNYGGGAQEIEFSQDERSQSINA